MYGLEWAYLLGATGLKKILFDNTQLKVLYYLNERMLVFSRLYCILFVLVGSLWGLCSFLLV